MKRSVKISLSGKCRRPHTRWVVLLNEMLNSRVFQMNTGEFLLSECIGSILHIMREGEWRYISD